MRTGGAATPRPQQPCIQLHSAEASCMTAQSCNACLLIYREAKSAMSSMSYTHDSKSLIPPATGESNS
jgi:hypothetical protein